MLFSFFFLSFSIISLFLGLYFFDYSSVIIDFSIPFFMTMEVPVSFLFDYVSFLFFSLVSMISFVVFLYSKFYMDERVGLNNLNNSRFFYLLFFFVISMMFLVFSNSWISMMLGWDGLGLVSFLLVIYFNNPTSLDSGLLTVFTNRLGDCMFIVSFIFLHYTSWFSLEFSIYSFSLFYMIIILGMMTKSAQFPFSSWLPAAMAAPTPVSSLVHSSTLVTAGIYLLIRFNYAFEYFYNFLMIISLITMLIGGVCAVYEKDFKKIVAMSTLSQLGFMVFSICSGFWVISLMHMMFHAFFKSSLFLSTGNLMHLISGDQDSRNFGGVMNSFFSKIIFIFSALSLSGFPFSLGFYSKDTILGLLMFHQINFLSVLFIFSCCLTVSYTFRIVKISMFLFPSFKNYLTLSEDKFFFVPVMLLFFISVFSGPMFMNLLPLPLVFSLPELFFGVIVLLSGVLIGIFLNFNFFFSNFLSSMTFLSLLWSSHISNILNYLSYKMEYSWGEVFSGKGVYTFFMNFTHEGKSLYNLYFMKIPFLLIIFLVMMNF